LGWATPVGREQGGVLGTLDDSSALIVAQPDEAVSVTTSGLAAWARSMIKWLSGGTDDSVPVIPTTMGLPSLPVLGLIAPAVYVFVVLGITALVPGTALWMMTVSKMGYGPGPNNSSYVGCGVSKLNGGGCFLVT